MSNLLDRSPYTPWAGQNKIHNSEKDQFNNPQGNEYDLAKDHAFEGLKIAVLHLYTGEGFDFLLPAAALRTKGFELIHWKDRLPDLETFKRGLDAASQLWLISTYECMLTHEYIELISNFFNEGKGLYIWGDNEPYFADANVLLKRLFDCTMFGNTWGEKMINIKTDGNKSGIIPQHPISTGIENFYEGSTVATVGESKMLTPMVYGSAGNVIASVYDREGKRAIVDGGFTRLYYMWHSAGTPRYVVNAAAWLANYERFGSGLLGEKKATIFDKMGKKSNSTNASVPPNINDIFNKF